jgi:hypothetical protein
MTDPIELPRNGEELLEWNATRWRQQAIAHYAGTIETRESSSVAIDGFDIEMGLRAAEFCLNMSITLSTLPLSQQDEMKRDVFHDTLDILKGIQEAKEGKTTSVDFSEHLDEP